jgi:hypothetical protein
MCGGMQRGLGRFLTFNMMGGCNPLQHMQGMQALQTLTLVVGQMGQ